MSGAGAVIVVVAVVAGLAYFKDELKTILKLNIVDTESTAQEGGGAIGAITTTIAGKDTKVVTKDEAYKTGGAAGVLSNNLISNLTMTPLPDDPVFGTKGVFGSEGFFADLFGWSTKQPTSETQKQANQVGLDSNFHEETSTQPANVTLIGTKGRRGKSVFIQ